jgi:hypothetical protein
MPDPSVAEVTFYANQGSTFRRRLWYGWSTKPPELVLSIADIDEMYDLSGCTAEMFVRTYDRTQIIQRLTTDDDSIVLNAVQGAIDLYVSAADTDLWLDKKYRHDLELTYTLSGDVVKKYKGTIFNEVTNTREI